MPQGPASIERSGRRILGYTAGSVVLLVGSWLALRDGTELAPPEPEPAASAEPAVASLPPENLDSSRRLFAEFDEDAFRAAAVDVPPDLVEARIQALKDRPPGPPMDPEIFTAQANQLAASDVAMTALADALESRRSSLRRACSPGRGQSSGSLFVVTTFGADGGLRDHSVTGDGDNTAVADCVQAQLGSLKIDAPGVEVMTRAKLEL